MKHGWIIQDKDSKKFLCWDGDCYSWGRLRDASVSYTRTEARDDRLDISDEIVRKVELYKNGKAKKIIKGR